MLNLPKPKFGAPTAIGYVTGGALLVVWTLVWYFTREGEMTRSMWFWLAGFFFTGWTLIVLGLLLGPIGRAAGRAEIPPAEVIAAQAAIEQTAAANPPVVIPPGNTSAVNPAMNVPPPPKPPRAVVTK